MENLEYFITLKDIRWNSWENTYMNLKKLIRNTFRNFSYLIKSDTLQEFEKEYFNSILRLNGDITDYSGSLSELTYYLFKHHGVKPIILIDEYDVPIQSGFVNKFYDDVIEFMRSWLGGGLKDNINLEFSVLTGILKISKESIFSGLNNLKVFTLIDKSYREYFGFTENEVQKITNNFNCKNNLEEIKEWYDKYNFAGLEVYNPWSVINYFYEKCVPQAYWLNTSSNAIIHDFIKLADSDMKQELEILLRGEQIKSVINTNIVYSDIYKSKDNLYSFLLLTGYLKVIQNKRIASKTYCTLTIPNKEIFYVYQDEIVSQLSSDLYSATMYDMLDALL